MGINSSKNYWFYVHRNIYTYAYIHAAHSFDLSSMKENTAHYKRNNCFTRKRDACFHVY